MNLVSNLASGNSKSLCIGLDKQGTDYSNREFPSSKVKLNQISNRISRPLNKSFSSTINIVLFLLMNNSDYHKSLSISVIYRRECDFPTHNQ